MTTIWKSQIPGSHSTLNPVHLVSYSRLQHEPEVESISAWEEHRYHSHSLNKAVHRECSRVKKTKRNVTLWCKLGWHAWPRYPRDWAPICRVAHLTSSPTLTATVPSSDKLLQHPSSVTPSSILCSRFHFFLSTSNLRAHLLDSSKGFNNSLKRFYANERINSLITKTK